MAWAMARVGAPGYALRCLAFEEDAYERANQIEVFGGATATESATQYGVLPYDPDEPPPAGSLVFDECAGPLDPAPRWTAPRLIGWTPAARLLEGHRPRSWPRG